MKTHTILLTSLLLAIPAFAADTAPEADRKAILAMAGKFKVHFHFKETLPFAEGYQLTKPYDEDAHELVVVAEDTPRRISLQHLLVVGGSRVVHHWRQVWTYEDTKVNEFQGFNTWKTRHLSPEQARGTWTQLVTQVDNSPRYESWGRWEHEGTSRWVGAETRRPLPRREHTKRKDYDAVVAVNTHILTAAGWAHEQANTKLDLPESKAIAREYGLNTYVRDETFDFSPAERFWAEYKGFSDMVAEEWLAVADREPSYKIEDDIETSSLRDETEEIRKSRVPAPEAREKVRAVLAKYVRKAAVADAR